MDDWIQADWPAPRNIRAVCTTRAGGFSQGAWASLNLGTHCGDQDDHVAQNREKLRKALPAAPQWLSQVHGTTVVHHPGRARAELQADAIVSISPGEVCAVLTADCLPVFFCNRAGDRVAVAHAGWRGLADGILQETIATLDVDPAELLAWMGPAIGPQAYEVGRELADAFPEEFPAGFTPRGDRFLLDLYTLAGLKLRRLGIQAIGGGGLCTLSDPTRFFSYRRDGVTGRMASLIWMQPDP
jgi:YfiH family protein